MAKAFSRWLPFITLSIWSFVLLYFYFSGRIAPYLHPMFRPLILCAGFGMIILALCFIFSPHHDTCCSEEVCGHPLSKSSFGRIITFLILLIPICVSAFFSKDSFGTNAILNRGIISDIRELKGAVKNTPFAEPALPSKDGTQQSFQQSSDTSQYLRRSPEGNIQAEIIDLMFAAEDESLRKDFENQPVEIIGQLMPDTTNNSSGNRFKVVRLFMQCCAADARPVSILAESNTSPNIPEMSWVKVVGFATFPIEGGRMIPIVKANNIQLTDPPQESMLY